MARSDAKPEIICMGWRFEGLRSGGRPGSVDDRGVFLAAVEAAPVPMVLSDPNRSDDPIVFANPAFLRMCGYERAEVLGRNCRFLQGPASDPGAVDAIRRAIRARSEVAVELLNYRKDGTPFWNALFVAPVFAPDGDLLYLFASQLDVSRRRQAEDALRRAGGRPVSDVAHDINNMLQVIAGHVEGLGEHVAASGDGRLLRRLRAVAAAADRATVLTRELLDGTREVETAAAATAPPEADRHGPGAARGGVAQGARILVVDDRAEVAKLARTMLESAGYAVDVAIGGVEALDKLGNGFDLLFSDLVMPGPLDGAALAREAQRRDPRLRVLLTTGRAGVAGADFETIVKPYRRSELVRTVRRLLDRPAGER